MVDENPYEFLGAAPEQSTSASVGILVYVELAASKFSEESFIAIGKARELGDMLGTGVGAVCADAQIEGITEQLFHAGADKLFIPENPGIDINDNMKMCDFLANILHKIEPEVFLAPMSDNIPDFLPRVAQRVGTGLVSGCIAIDIDTTDRAVLATRPAYGGKMHEIHVCATARPQMILLMPDTFPPPIMDEFRTGTIEKVILQ